MEEDIEDREDRRAEIMTNGLISFQKFLKEFKQVVKDEVIQKINNKFEISYNFRKFNIECYIIDKKYYDEFCKAINFKEISKVLSIINEENTEKCKQMVKERLKDENFNIDVNDIQFYADQEGLKKIVGHFNNYSFLNKELLVDCMGVPEEKLKSKKIFVSKNEKNTTLLNIEENFTMSINIVKKDVEKEVEIKKEVENKVQIKKKPKNLYYVENITKKIFLLLYKKDELLNKKIHKNSKDSYKFKNYYLISKEWLKSYKENFLYGQIISKIDEELKSHSYKRIKTELDSIIKDKIGQIKLYGSSEIEPGLRDANKLLPKIKPIKENKDNNDDFVRRVSIIEETVEPEQELTQSYEVPSEFEIINEDIYELLKKEEFLENFDEKLENQLCYQILFGNKWMIIKNKSSENFEEKDDYSNELLFYRKNVQNDNDINDDYILGFILNFEKKVNFYEEIGKIFSHGIKKYINNTKINLESNCTQEKILDESLNVLGKIFNVNINPDMINDEINDNEKDISNDNIIQNINEIKFSDINENKKENNFDQNEIIYIDDQENKIILNNDINHEDEKDYSVEDIQKKIKIMNKVLASIIDRIYYNRNNQTQLNLHSLESDELDKIINESNNINGAYEIILMDEDKYKNFYKMYNLDEIKSILITYKNNQIEGKNLMEKNKEKFNKFLNRIKNQKFKEDNIFQLNDDYETCINNINENKKFVLLSATYFDYNSKKKNNKIYYFIHNEEIYIFFKKEKKILKVKPENIKSEFCKLEIYKIEDKNKIAEYLSSLKEIRNKFKNKNYDQLKEPINEYYLINDKWIDFAENKLNERYIYTEEKFIPNYTINGLGHRYPKDFFIVSTEEKNKLMMDNLINYFQINNEEIVINKIFINMPNYICLLNNSVAYFLAYMKNKEISKGKELLELLFFITFKDERIMKEEIINKISLLGIEAYINLMFLSNKEPYNIYDMSFNQIGSIINMQNKNLFNKKKEYFDSFTKNDNLIKIRSLLILFSNLKELRDYIPENKAQTDKDNKIDIAFLSNFFAVLRYIEKINSKLNGKKPDNIIVEKCEDIFNIFLTQIQDLSIKDNKIKNINIFKNFHILIKIIILELQKILYQLQTKQNFDYDEEILYKNRICLNQNNEKLIIQKLFFFELQVIQHGCKCEDNNFYQIKYYLKFDLNEKDKNSLKIISLFDKLKEIEICKTCKKERKIKKKLISLPEYLIIIVKDTTKYITTFLEKTIDIKKSCYIAEKKIEYELISFADLNFRPIIKFDNIWKGSKTEQFNLSEERKMPNLLIYKQIKKK